MTGRSTFSTCIAPARSPRVSVVLCFSSVFDACLAQRDETILLFTPPLDPFPRIAGPQFSLASASRPSTSAH
jgi:hypothetical protein